MPQNIFFCSDVKKEEKEQVDYGYLIALIISEQKCGVLNFPKMQRNYC